MAKDTILTANQAFVTEVNGERLEFTAGDPVEAGHPAVKANPHLFGPLVFRHPINERADEPPKAKEPDKPKDKPKEPEKAPEGKPMRVRP